MQCWDIGVFAAFFVIFSLLPLLAELIAFLYTSKIAVFMKY